MKLYHYATWEGEQIAKEGYILPLNNYGFGEMILLAPWPKLVFLTSNPEWEPSVQARTVEGYHEKCGSHPDIYCQLGIPCWKFEVEILKKDVSRVIKMSVIEEDWLIMLNDARRLGSDISQWYVIDVPVGVAKCSPLVWLVNL